MEKKYQVFVSSTYEGLQEERKKVMEALLQMNCFPVGMEYFNASDSSQWEVIKSLIRECDYYILIVAGRYGSIEEKSEKSYTQKEFEYAIDQKVPVISFLHKIPDNIPQKYIETDIERSRLLEAFKTDVKKRLCKFWDNADGLASQVVLSLTSLIKTNPRIGWVKADEVSSAEANRELLKLRKDNEELVRQVRVLSSKIPEGTEKMKQGEDTFLIHYELIIPYASSDQEDVSTKKVSWNQIFLSVCTTLLKPVTEDRIRECLEQNILDEYNYIVDDDFQTILIQLMALKLIETNIAQGEGVYTYWILTPYGRSVMVNLKAQRRS